MALHWRQGAQCQLAKMCCKLRGTRGNECNASHRVRQEYRLLQRSVQRVLRELDDAPGSLLSERCVIRLSWIANHPTSVTSQTSAAVSLRIACPSEEGTSCLSPGGTAREHPKGFVLAW